MVVGVALIHRPFVDEVLAYIARDGRFRSCSTNDDEGLDMKLDMKFDLAVVPDAHSLAVDRTVNAPPVTIVMSPVGAPLEMGLVESLAHPGGSVTGLSNMEAELGGKRLDLLREAIPGLARVAILAANTDPFTAPFVKDLQTGAARLGLQLQAALFALENSAIDEYSSLAWVRGPEA